MTAKSGVLIETISLEQFDALLEDYTKEVPSKLEDLEDERLRKIPAALAEREDAHLTKKELQTLMEWKLAHGKFRPSLRRLIASNSEETVEETSRSAFALYTEDYEAWEAAISMLAKGLRGVGPATASLLLNVYDDIKVPFFSDELFRWTMYEEGKGKGWDRAIKYTIVEYREMFSRVMGLRLRLNEEHGEREVKSSEVEMVAYVLGRKKLGEEASVSSKTAGEKADTGYVDRVVEQESRARKRRKKM